LFWEITGSRGAIQFDQERMNELRLFTTDGPADRSGFATILTGPAHPPYGRFCPAPGHGLGFNDLKVIEADHLLRGIAGEDELFPDFSDALAIERVIHGIVASASERTWRRIRGA
jgi:predicted dehydrogenase